MNLVSIREDEYKHPLVSALENREIDEKEFWQKIPTEGTPLLAPDPQSSDHTFVTYICKVENAHEHVVVQPGGYADPLYNVLTRVSNTTVCYACYKCRNDLRLHYTFALNMPLVSWDDANEREIAAINRSYFEAKPDEHNPKEAKLRFRSASLLELENAVDESLVAKRPNIERGHLGRFRLKSDVFGAEREIRVYTPPNYADNKSDCKVLFVLDGAEYLSLIPTHRILDNLSDDQSIAPVIAVFIENPTQESRYSELACSEQFLSFFASELLPWVQANYRISNRQQDVCIGGSSLGGLTALWLGRQLPDRIGNIISQAAALSYLTRPDQPKKVGQMLVEQYEREERLPLRIWLEVGLLEDPLKMIEPNRRLKLILEAKGYELYYHEFAGGHDFTLWRGSFAQALLKIFGKNES